MLSQPTMIPTHLPIFPLSDQVAFPHTIFPLFLNSDEVSALEELLHEDRLIGLAFIQREDRPGFHALARVGTACRVNKIVRFPDGGCKIMVEGLQRIRLHEPVRQDPIAVFRVEVVDETETGGLVTEALVQSVNSLLKIALAYGRPLPGDVIKMIDQIEEAGRLADLVAVYLQLETSQQQNLLENFDPLERLKEVYLHLTSEVQKLQVRGDVQSEVVKRLGKNQKEYLLREQLKQIQSELGDEDPRQSEIKELRDRIQEAGMPEEVLKIAEKELGRLERINPASPEHTVARNYLEYLCNAPWARSTKDSLDVCEAQTILDEDHYDLTEVKERILEYLAVRSLKKTTKGPILCFVGPPGVGKTSLGRSIARAMGRRFIRMSLGGMRDEAEIRGHRRTYIGALPGRIIQELCRAEANNPVFMLDEVDKIGQDFRGDPASALLEVLDPEQNNSFVDHYLDVPFDLSNVMFITTANILDPVPHALKDRMEVIRLSGYGDEEKLQIAFRYLVPKQLDENALANRPVEFSRESILKMIQDHTREAGVRNLERQIASICRKIAKEVAQNDSIEKNRIEAADVEEMLGPPKYFADVAAEEDRIGVVTGLAWTEAGGDIVFVEVSRMPGKNNLVLTGSLGEVMQESAKAALSYVRAHAEALGIDPGHFENSDIHVHVPAGAIPKDGPSAGITIAAALISLFTGRPARKDVAMTGELTLSGRILPIGGVKEKVLAAQRAGVKTVLLPRRNEGSLRDLDPPILEKTDIEFVDSMADVVALIFPTRTNPVDRSRPAAAVESSSFTGASHGPPASP